MTSKRRDPEAPGSMEIVTSLSSLINDDEVKARTKRLAMVALDQCEFILLNGNIDMKMKIMSKVLPALTRALENGESKENEFEELKAQFQSLMDEVRQVRVAVEEIDDDSGDADIPQDTGGKVIPAQISDKAPTIDMTRAE